MLSLLPQILLLPHHQHSKAIKAQPPPEEIVISSFQRFSQPETFVAKVSNISCKFCHLSSLILFFCIIQFNVCLFLSHRFNCLWLEKHVHLEVIPLSSVFVYPRPRESESSMVCCHQFWTSVQLHWTTQFYKISGWTNFGPVMENLMSANAQCGSSVDEAKC